MNYEKYYEPIKSNSMLKDHATRHSECDRLPPENKHHTGEMRHVQKGEALKTGEFM